jgi:hypothetical protein
MCSSIRDVYNGAMDSVISENNNDRRSFAVAVRLLLMIAIVGALIVASGPTRALPAGEPLTVWINILFFVALGAADELILGPVLNRLPLARAAALIAETLALGWFFSPGRENPASKLLFFVHIGPFFVAVFAGAICALLLRRWRGRDTGKVS